MIIVCFASRTCTPHACARAHMHTHTNTHAKWTVLHCRTAWDGTAGTCGQGQPWTQKEAARLTGSVTCSRMLPARVALTHAPYRVQLYHGLQLLDSHLWLHVHHDLPCGVRGGAPLHSTWQPRRRPTRHGQIGRQTGRSRSNSESQGWPEGPEA